MLIARRIIAHAAIRNEISTRLQMFVSQMLTTFAAEQDERNTKVRLRSLYFRHNNGDMVLVVPTDTHYTTRKRRLDIRYESNILSDK